MSRKIWTKPFVKTILSGDQRKARSLERKARSYVGYLFDQLMPNQKFRSQNWNLADGSRITAFVWKDVLGERARVEIFAPDTEIPIIYSSPQGLESGILILPGNATVAVSPGTPATLVPLKYQILRNGLELDALLDKHIGVRQFDYRDYGAGSMESRSLSVAVEDALVKKFTTLTSSWELTGKLGLLVKCQMSGISDARLTRITSWLFSIRQQNGEIKHESIGSSYWLYTEELGKYIMVWVDRNEDSIKIRRVLPRATAEYVNSIKQSILDAGLQPTDVDYRRYEAYLLAVCDFEIDSEWYKIATLSDDVPTACQSLFYGWKPTWLGTKASIVAHTMNGLDPIETNLYTISCSPNAGYDGDAAYAIDNLPFTVSITNRASGEWTPKLVSDAVWIPSSSGIQVSAFWYSRLCGTDWNQEVDSANVPIYCWYDIYNRLVQVTYSRIVYDNLTNEYENNSSLWALSQGSWSGADGTKTFPPLEWTMDRGTSQFSVIYGEVEEVNAPHYPSEYVSGDGSVSLGGSSASYFARYTFDWYCGPPQYCDNYDPTGDPLGYPSQCVDQNVGIMSQGAANPDWIPWTVYDPEECECYEAFKRSRIVPMLHSFNTSYTFREGSETTTLALVIPGGNAEAVYLLRNTQVAETGYDQSRETYLGGSDKDVLSPLINYRWHIFTDCHGGTGAGCSTQDASLTEQTNIYDSLTFTVDRYMCDKWGTTSYPQLSDSGTSVTAEIPNDLGSFFVANACEDPPKEYIGYFLNIASTEGPKFFLTNPGGLEYREFGSNFEIDWNPGHFMVFAGWQ